jgi:transposase
MRSVHIIPLDTHCQSTEFGVMTRSGRLTHRGRCPTTVPALRAVIESVPRPRHVVFEEGPLADWLWRNLREIADEVVVCDPRRNHLIARDGDKDDAIDVEKLGQLYRGNHLRRVHHSDSEDRAFFKQLVSMYHRRVREAVRLGNQALYELRRHGIVVTTAALKGPERPEVLARLPHHAALRTAVRLVLAEYDQMRAHAAKLRREIIQLAQGYEPIGRFMELPGVKWVRAATFLAYIDTPWRFKKRAKLWKYMGIGLDRSSSGSGPERVRVVPAVRASRPLKNMILMAAKSAICQGDNPFAEIYERLRSQGQTPRNARRTAARAMASTLWALWKNGSGVIRMGGRWAVESCVGGRSPLDGIGPGLRAKSPGP